MMSKERLEELHKYYISGIINADDLVQEVVKLEQLIEELLDYAKEQAELVKELEDEIEDTENIYIQQLEESERTYDYFKKEIERYKQALELVEDELEYAKTTGNDEVRDMYIKNSIRFINEALEGEE